MKTFYLFLLRGTAQVLGYSQPVPSGQRHSRASKCVKPLVTFLSRTREKLSEAQCLALWKRTGKYACVVKPKNRSEL